MKKTLKKGFTLAEILITLTIIGVVAAITLPSVMTNVTQNQYKTGLKKAINVLNDSLQTNLAQEGDTPYIMSDDSWDINEDGVLDVGDETCIQIGCHVDGRFTVKPAGLAAFLMRHMNVVKTKVASENGSERANFAFYTTDGLRFELPFPRTISHKSTDDGKVIIADDDVALPLYEQENVTGTKIKATSGSLCGMQEYTAHGCSTMQACGSAGLVTNPNHTTTPPCIVMVDVNGDKKPNPKNIQIPEYNSGGETKKSGSSFTHDKYTTPDPSDNMLTDVFTLLVTDRHVIPYGVVAQRTMYDEN